MRRQAASSIVLPGQGASLPPAGCRALARSSFPDSAPVRRRQPAARPGDPAPPAPRRPARLRRRRLARDRRGGIVQLGLRPLR